MTNEKSIIDLAKTPPQTNEMESPREALERRQAVAKGEHLPSSNPVVNTEQLSTEHQDTLKKLLEKSESKISWVPIDLPSRGKFNSSDSASIQIKPFTFEDEKILRNIKKVSDGAKVITTLIKRCSKDLNYENLPLVDKNFILYKLRELSYGNDYKIEATCTECSETNGLAVEINKLPVNYLDEEVNFEVVLPDSEVTVKYKIPTVKEEVYLDSVDNLMDNLWRLVESIDGHTERVITQGFVAKSTAKDITVLRNAITDSDLGIQTLVHYVCNSCNSDSVVDLPINESFFGVS